MAFIGQLLNALIAIPKIADIVMAIAEAVTTWYISKANEETNKYILDAAALSARAKTQEDRSKALDAWRLALSRTRYIR